MPDTIKTGTIMIKDGTLLPADLLVQSEIYAPRWKVVKNFDGYGLDRKINEANWKFFYLAGDIKATVLGREGQKTVRKGVKRILAKLKGEKFNSLEITEIASKRFLGIPFMSVAAHSRHIQQGIGLVPAKDFVLRMSAAAPKSRLDSGGEQHRANAAKQYTALISSS